MTVLSELSTVQYTGNGATTNFPFSFPILEADHLVVTRVTIATGVVAQTYTSSEYTVAGLGDPAGGSVTILGTAVSSSFYIVIDRVVPYTQELDINNQGGFYPDTVEEALDLLTMQVQQVLEVAEEAGEAVDVSFDPAGNIAATNVQAAIEELDSEKVAVATLSESIDDRVAALLVAGTNVTLSYNDGAGTLTISATIASVTAADVSFSPTGGVAANTVQAAIVEVDSEKVALTALSELIDDRVAALLLAGTNIQLNYNDGAGTLTVSATSGAGATLSDGDYGDAVVSVTGTVITIDPAVLTAFGRTLTAAANAAAAATLLGLGTGDSPQFTAINIGHATDTTLARASAGNLTVEGNVLYRAGGTVVAIADGGSGQGSAAAAATAFGVGTGNSPQFAGINVGHASDTTITRVSAGIIAVEGVAVVTAASPAFTGTPTAPTPAVDDADTSIATTAFVDLFKDMPIASAFGDRGKMSVITAGLTINTGYAAGTIFGVYVDSASDLTLTSGAGLTLRKGGSTTTGNRTLLKRGFTTVWCKSTTEYIIQGAVT